MKVLIRKRILIYILIALVSSGLCVSLGAYALWYFAIYPYEVTPVAPLPTGATLMRHVAGSGTQGFWYIDKYTVDAPIAEVEVFYQSRSYCCRHLSPDAPGILVDNRSLTCNGDASPLGTFDVEIGRQNASEGGKTLLVIWVSWAVAK